MPFLYETIGVPVPQKSWYQAWLHRCVECGATVNRSEMPLHERWHESLREGSK